MKAVLWTISIAAFALYGLGSTMNHLAAMF
jgi:hypothetical protein